MKLKKEIRKKRVRFKIRKKMMERICVNRTAKNIYAQIISSDGKKVLVSASTLDKDIKKEIEDIKPMEAAKQVGVSLAKRAKKLGFKKKLAFDRSGFKYHGRVKELAKAARQGGLLF
ncbi:50S ribosomal protein L18 [Candidatus Portiera aleyrodidarum]|uniref:Large ribosomal subunit protein uL18 n=1 Tax=Candidatus Portiera aleyrodidarum TV TaxID=1297582 RepID=A0A8D3X7B8_9GAMM|nr:50S ribosomal protein L18 [Candidatus Portiera aleyrodidarum]AGI27112.1 ribosomal protein L18 [Candidatus Portiera aleyrodidarum TV]